MYTKQDLIQCLKGMGLKSTDAIMVHSSMKAIGEVEGGADTVVDAFLNDKIANRFAGIWLDVCEIEPLPEQHPLFYVPNLLITPHITGGFHLDLTMEKIFQISLHNMKAWLGEGNYIHVLDLDTGYCK